MRTMHFQQLLLLLVLSTGLSNSAHAADLVVTESNTLDFGSVLDQDGAVIMNVSNNITSDTSGIHLGGSVQSGVYLITGDPSCNVKITLTGSNQNGLTLDNFSSSPSGINNVNLGGSGSVSLTLGGRLTVSSATAGVGLNQPLSHTINVTYKGNCSGNGNPANTAFNGLVDVQQALSLIETTELDFGAVTDEDGTITLDLADSISSDPSGIGLGGTIASGVYTAGGTPNATVSVSLTGSSSAGLTIGNFTSSEPDLFMVSLGGSGSKDITLGADLTVSSASAAPGLDQPLSFTITVNYN